MCGCTPHLLESASQFATNASTVAPFLGTVGAAFCGGKLGQIFLKLCLWNRKSLVVDDGQSLPEG